jgi:predicted glycogen debranching enzyme
VRYTPHAEWLETAGNGAFAMGTVSRVRTRRYHALLMHADSPSSGRRVLVPGFDAWLEFNGVRVPLTPQRYQNAEPDPTVWPSIAEFAYRPWPAWTFRTPAGPWREELFISAETGETILRWSTSGFPAGARFYLRLFLSCRDYHALKLREDGFNMEPETHDGLLVWRPYPDAPGVAIHANGDYTHEPHWYERFDYREEHARGFDHVEDLASPGVYSWAVGDPASRPTMVLRALASGATAPGRIDDVAAYSAKRASAERARRTALDPLDFSASQYIVNRGTGKSIIAGYPWFADWGRDTFIALRGLCLSRGDLDNGKSIVETWADVAEDGLLPNCFRDDHAHPDYCAVDTALWFVVAANELLTELRRAKRYHRAFDTRIRTLSDAILAQFIRGTNFAIRADADGLIAAGIPGRALTWMDARVDGEPVTARVGKPVEVQCLWVNALETARRRSPEWNALLKIARRSFVDRFWHASRGYLADVADPGHVPGTEDTTLRPNQIFAVGGLPSALVPKRIGRKIVETVHRELFTPLGLRTLAPGNPEYRGQYQGGPIERDSAYHQGTVWPWLMGAFGEAYLRVNGDSAAARAWVREHCLAPLRAQLDLTGLGHLPEIASGDPPHTPNGCPFQAWSLGEFLRLKQCCARTATRRTGTVTQ